VLEKLIKPEIGDKFCSQGGGQKNLVGNIVNPEDLPFTKDGMQPDVIVNPHLLPSRMTIAYFIEILNSVLFANNSNYKYCKMLFILQKTHEKNNKRRLA